MLNALFIRHGETGLNKDNRFRGFQDVPLNESGISDAHKIAQQHGKGLDRIYTSDLKRASETAKIISGGKTPVHQLPDLRPWNIGQFSGMKKDTKTRQQLEGYAKSGEAPPGGETIHQFGQRFRSAMKTVSAKPGRIAVVAHASNMHELGKMLHGDMDSLDVKPGGVVRVSVPNNGPTSAKIISRPNHEPALSVS